MFPGKSKIFSKYFRSFFLLALFFILIFLAVNVFLIINNCLLYTSDAADE